MLLRAYQLGRCVPVPVADGFEKPVDRIPEGRRYVRQGLAFMLAGHRDHIHEDIPQRRKADPECALHLGQWDALPRTSGTGSERPSQIDAVGVRRASMTVCRFAVTERVKSSRKRWLTRSGTPLSAVESPSSLVGRGPAGETPRSVAGGAAQQCGCRPVDQAQQQGAQLDRDRPCALPGIGGRARQALRPAPNPGWRLTLGACSRSPLLASCVRR